MHQLPYSKRKLPIIFEIPKTILIKILIKSKSRDRLKFIECQLFNLFEEKNLILGLYNN